MPTPKKITIQERLTFTLNYIKNFLFIIIPLTSFIGYIGVLVIKDTAYYKKIDSVVSWYEKKSQSFAVGIRVNKVKDDHGKVIYKVIYKSIDGEIHRAFYKEKLGAFYYSDEFGKLRECH